MFNYSRKTRVSTALAAGASASVLLSVVATSAMAAPAPAPKATAATNASCPAAPGVTPTSISLGMIDSVTGPASTTFLGSKEAAQLRVDQENAKGGVYGRKIKLITYDDELKPAKSVANAKLLINASAKQQQDGIWMLGRDVVATGRAR